LVITALVTLFIAPLLGNGIGKVAMQTKKTPGAAMGEERR
jgi:hypothetical protein